MYVNVRAFIERRKEYGTEVLIQIRAKSPERVFELPGGRLEEYEPLLEGLKREVFEETGLAITRIMGEETRISTNNSDTNVECLKPFAVYQTIQGPVDSMGVYFICEAEGEPLKDGDETENPHWVTLSELRQIVEDGRFSWIDLAGVKLYLKKQGYGNLSA